MSKSTPLTLLTEIQKQPDLLRVLFLTQLEILQDTPNIPLNLQKIIAIAEGSSKNVLDIASPFWEEWLGLPVWVHLPEALEQKMSISTQYGKMDTVSPDQKPSGNSFRIADLIERSLLFLVSQSGETGSILRLLDKLLPHLHPHSYQVVSLTNRDPSSLSKRFQHLIY
ncbi:MAG: hypothetical protein K2X66_11605, partial [Cyanobacteria bacterium]|nr:hypothetical protein [Cyanobacteriota bacterium]